METSSKNILYIGPYRQNDGWGLAAKGYLLSLLTTHHNIVAVPIYLSNAKANITEKSILESENRSCKNYDIIIQKALPPAICPNKYAKNIALIVLENNKLYSDGIQNLKAMDEIWVPSNKEIKCLQRSNIPNTSRSIMQAIPTEDISVANSEMLFNSPITQKSYKFYFIGEYIHRKNLHDLIVAFHTEFSLDESVSLIIKTSVPGLDPHQSMLKIQQDIQSIKKKLRIRKNFKEEIIITDKLSQSQLFSIHKSCDCFVSVSYGEAFCRPAAEALCFGKPIIITNNIGIAEMVDDQDKLIVDTQEQPVVVQDLAYVDGLDMYNANETWSIPSVISLKEKMRQAFETRKTVNSSNYLEKFSYNNIGKILCQFIQ